MARVRTGTPRSSLASRARSSRCCCRRTRCSSPSSSCSSEVCGGHLGDVDGHELGLGGLEGAQLGAVASEREHVEVVGELLGALLGALDEHDLVLVGEVLGDRGADLAGADDDQPHRAGRRGAGRKTVPDRGG
jgi:hypothetical protein